jgi:hypothetical protein
MLGSHSNGHPYDLSFSSPFYLAGLHCGGSFVDPQGEIFLPELSGSLAHNRQCFYVIKQPEGEKIEINFTHVELEGQSDCSYSYIEVTFTAQSSLSVHQQLYVLWSLQMVAKPAAFTSLEILLEMPFYT